MNSSLIAISTLIKNNIGEKWLLRDYLKLANIYKGDAIKRRQTLLKWLYMGVLLIN